MKLALVMSTNIIHSSWASISNEY